MRLCTPCRETRDLSYSVPLDLVHPEHERPGIWSVRGEQKCPHCGALWRMTARNTFELLK